VAQTKVVRRNAVKANNYGVTYSLPQTSLVVTAEVTQVTCKAGPYYQYAEKYLGVKDIVTADKVYYELGEVSVEDVGIPDPELTFLIEFRPATVAPFVCLTEDGLLCSINTDYDPEPTNADKPKTPLKAEPAGAPAESVFSEELLMAGSIARQAEVAAKQIYRIRESRLNILTGEADNLPPDGEAMKITIAELEAQEKALTNLFVGVRTQATERYTVSIVPRDEFDREILFRFSSRFGVVESDDLSGDPVIMNLVATELPPQPDPRELEKKLKGDKGIVYTLSGKAAVEIRLNGKSLYRNEIRLAQFGAQECLAPTLFEDKKNPVKITFYPQTGSIKQILQ
jgi:hypothetical protein